MTQEASYIDELSGVYNRRYLKEQQAEAIKVFISNKVPISIVMVDIDHFKEINDTYGHVQGDEIIREFAQFLKNTLRVSDTVIRYGGDEFVCVMASTMRQDAEWINRRILKQCREREFSGIRVTLSVGIASYPDDGHDLEELLKVADQSLYDAKRSGRDRIGVVRRKKLELPIKVFIGRVEERERLRGILRSDGGLRVAVIKGNVGIGKTRLCREALNDMRGSEIVWSDCVCFAEGIAYYPIREALRYRVQRLGCDFFREIPMVYKLELGKLIPEMAEGLTDESAGEELVLDKYRLYEGIRRALELGDRPKVIVVDNIQWIDTESLEVIEYLVRALRDSPMVLILICRTEEVTEFLGQFFSSISQDVNVTETELKPFTDKQVEECIKSIVGEDAAVSLVEYVVRESGGIPFYIEEVMRGLLNKEYLAVEDDAWVFRKPEKELVPRSLSDIALRKYRSLSKEAQRILDIASVVGWFDVGIIKQITEYNEGEIIGLINDISRLGMVRYAKERFEFGEEINRRAIYKESVEGIKGMALHRRVGDELEEQTKGKENGFIELLAFHYYHGQEREKGMRYCVEAGERAQKKYANQEAIKYYTWALELSKDDHETEKMKIRVDCLLKKARVVNLIGDNEGALKGLEEALHHARVLSDKHREADILLTISSVYRDTSRYNEAIEQAKKCKEIYQKIGNKDKIGESLYSMAIAYRQLTKYEQAMVFYEEALKIFRETHNSRSEAKVLNSIGNIYSILGKHSGGLEFFRDSLKLAQDKGYTNLVGASLVGMGIVYKNLGDYTNALKYYEDSLKIHREMGGKLGESTICHNIGNLYNQLGEYHNSVKSHEAALRIEREIDDKSGAAISLVCLGGDYMILGDYVNAMKLFEESLEIAKAVGNKDTEAYCYYGMGEVHYLRGDYRNALESYKDTQKIVEELKIVGRVGYDILISLGRYYLTLHDMTKAKEFMVKAHSVATDSHSDAMLRISLLLMCEVHLEEENLSALEKALNDIETLAEQVKTKSYKGNVHLLRGRYYTKIGNFNKADEYFKESLKMFSELGEKFHVGEVYYHLAIMELTKGNKPQAGEYAAHSCDVFSSVGAKGWQEKADEIFKQSSS